MDVNYLHANEVLNQNPKKPILFYFHFEIVLACSSSSLGTIFSTNIFGAVARDEVEVYLPWVFIIQLILRGEQNQQIF